MSLDVFLQRFGPSDENVGRHVPTLGDLAHAAQEIVGKNDVSVGTSGDTFTIDLPAGTATVSADHAQFSLQDLDDVSVRVMFAMARTGDMTVITEGGKYLAILTDPAQRARLPQDWIGKDESVPICQSVEELRDVLLISTDNQRQWREGVIAEMVSNREPANPVLPGTQSDDFYLVIYLEAKPKETSLKHLNRAIKFCQRVNMAGGPNCPKRGGLGGTAWRLETPAGQGFYALKASGDKAAWLSLIRDYAHSEGRIVGQIVYRDAFVLDDGRRFPVSECSYRKVDE